MGRPREIPEGQEARYFEIFQSIVTEDTHPESGTSWGTILGNLYDLTEDPLGHEFVAVVRAENTDGQPASEMRDQAQNLAMIAATLGSIAEDLMELGTKQMQERIDRIETDGPDEVERVLGIAEHPGLTRAQLNSVTPLIAGYLKASIPALTFAVGSVHFEAMRRLDAETEAAEFEAQASAELDLLFEDHGIVE